MGFSSSKITTSYFSIFILLFHSFISSNSVSGGAILTQGTIFMESCPHMHWLHPCYCESSSPLIECHSHHLTAASLTEIFAIPVSQLSPSGHKVVYRIGGLAIYPVTTFKNPGLNIIHINQTEANMFKGYQFDSIVMADTNLFRIHKDTFPDSVNYTRTLDFFRNRLQYKVGTGSRMTTSTARNESHSDEPGDEYDLFQFIRQFRNLRTINLERNEIQHIPDWAFSSLSLLTQISLNVNQITTIGSHPFFPVPMLREIELTENQLTHFSRNVFVFTNSSIRTKIYIKSNRLDDQSFAILNNTNRPIELDISMNRMTSLPRYAFQSLLQSHPSSEIRVFQNEIRCSCHVKWLLQRRHLFMNNVKDIVCNGTIPLFSLPLRSLGRC